MSLRGILKALLSMCLIYVAIYQNRFLDSSECQLNSSDLLSHGQRPLGGGGPLSCWGPNPTEGTFGGQKEMRRWEWDLKD